MCVCVCVCVCVCFTVYLPVCAFVCLCVSQCVVAPSTGGLRGIIICPLISHHDTQHGRAGAVAVAVAYLGFTAVPLQYTFSTLYIGCTVQVCVGLETVKCIQYTGLCMLGVACLLGLCGAVKGDVSL